MYIMPRGRYKYCTRDEPLWGSRPVGVSAAAVQKGTSVIGMTLLLLQQRYYYTILLDRSIRF